MFGKQIIADTLDKMQGRNGVPLHFIANQILRKKENLTQAGDNLDSIHLV